MLLRVQRDAADAARQAHGRPAAVHLTLHSLAHLADLPSVDDATLQAMADQLTDFEQRVSGYRRDLFERIDALQAEITRRYKTGEASVDTLLQ